MINESTAIVRRFLKQNRPNEYHLITAEVYDAMTELVKHCEQDSLTADSLRAVKGHLDNIVMYREKGYDEGINTSIERSYEILDNNINKLVGKE